jgi:pantetheine-phosphate adenylyltransferase
MVNEMKIAICPGSFDPITLGHVDIIRRSSQMFDKVIVAVLVNGKKSPAFTVEERKQMIKKSVAGIPNVEVDAFNGLLADYVQQKKAKAIIKGLRALSDFEYEFQMALMNKKLNPDVETMFLTTSIEYMYLSSSAVREIGSNGGDISAFVAPVVCEEIAAKLRK